MKKLDVFKDAVPNGCKGNCCAQDHCYQRLWFYFRTKKWRFTNHGEKRDLNEMLKLGSQDFFWREKRVKDM